MARKPYEREVPRYRWYFRQTRYLRYMAREVTCLFVGAYCLLLIVGLGRLAQGQAPYEAFLVALRHPASIAFHVFALAFAGYNTVTWFNVTPKALPLQIGEKLVSGRVIAGAHYVVWLALSFSVFAAAGLL